jgi:hypothetical protein
LAEMDGNTEWTGAVRVDQQSKLKRCGVKSD